jgi:hypothetical protein
VEWQTFAEYSFDVVGLDYFPRFVLNPELGAIKVSDLEINSCQSLK